MVFTDPCGDIIWLYICVLSHNMTRIHFNKEFIQSTVLQQQVLNAAMSPLVLLQDGRWATLRQVSRWRRRCDVSVVFEAGMCEAAEKDLYAVLGSSPSDSVQQLRHRYQQLALQVNTPLGGGLKILCLPSLSLSLCVCVCVTVPPGPSRRWQFFRSRVWREEVPGGGRRVEAPEWPEQQEAVRPAEER